MKGNEWFNPSAEGLIENLGAILPYYPLVKKTDDGMYFFWPPGREHYHLLAYFASMVPSGSKILEIGTRSGVSAISMRAGNKDISITTCDLENTFIGHESIDFRQINGLDLMEEFKDCPFIFIDVDPHDGVQERVMIAKLKEVGFKGILVLDDIKLNQDMCDFWNEIDVEKYNFTNFGHHSGTGVVNFGSMY
jgi:predicted O-methyltransferase YrrM